LSIKYAAADHPLSLHFSFALRSPCPDVGVLEGGTATVREGGREGGKEGKRDGSATGKANGR